MTAPALALKGVHAGYGPIEALHGIDLEVAEGEIATLIGCNGAGKSTTLNTISGLVPTREGTIELFGQRIERLPARKIAALGISQSPEGRRLFSDLTVLENLEMGAYLRRDAAGIKADVARAYELFPILAERRHQQAGQLSGGEQQMCAIARCLMARPRVMLLDEPSLGLAPLIAQQIFAVIAELNRAGTAILLVEQNANAALKLAARAYVIETGSIAIAGPARELLADPRVQAAYLGL